MFTNLTPKKKLIYIIAAVVLVIAISIGTVFLIRFLHSGDTTQTETTPTEASADSLKAQAIDALNTNAIDKAKTLFQKAKQQYEDLGDTNNVVDTKAQLDLIEYQYTPSP